MCVRAHIYLYTNRRDKPRTLAQILASVIFFICSVRSFFLCYPGEVLEDPILTGVCNYLAMFIQMTTYRYEKNYYVTYIYIHIYLLPKYSNCTTHIYAHSYVVTVCSMPIPSSPCSPLLKSCKSITCMTPPRTKNSFSNQGIKGTTELKTISIKCQWVFLPCITKP